MVRLKQFCIVCISALLWGGLSPAMVACSDEDVVKEESQNPDGDGDKPETPDSVFVETCKILLGRVKDANMPSTPTGADAAAEKWMGQMSEDGSFPDVDYAATAYIPEWSPMKHVDRLKPMVQSYVTEGSAHYGDERLYNAIVNGLTYWNTMHPVCDNWYSNQIAVPQDICVMLVLLRYGTKPVPEDLEASILEYFEEYGGNPAEQTGANQSDVALHWFYRGCLQANKEVVETSVFYTFRPLDCVNPEEDGIQYDYSYFQHGPQLYVGGYAPVMLSGVTRLASYTAGTDYRPSANQLRTLYHFVCDTYLPSIRHNVQFYNVVGRSVSRLGALKSNPVSILNALKEIDAEHAADYEQNIALAKGEIDYASVSERLAWYHIGDYMAFQGSDYSVGLRLSSTRTERCENGNKENLKGYFMSDGSLSLALEGDEYLDIFPVWNWLHIPGVTCPQVEQIPLDEAWGTAGEADFCGGLSDGKYGLATFRSIYKKHDLDMSACKSYFFLDGRIVCLGSGIQSDMSVPVHTAVEQCIAEGEVIWAANGTETILSGVVTDQDVDYVWHRNVGYFFPVPQKVSVELKTQSGTWFDINENQKKDKVNKSVCSIWLNHGNPSVSSPATYAYVLVPGVDRSAMKEYNYGVKILKNNAEQQAVSDTRSGMLQAVFYKKGEIKTDDVLLTVNKPCGIMLKKKDDNTYEISISDVARNLSEVTVTVERNRKKVSHTFTSLNEERAYRGRTHTALVSIE